MNQDEINLQTLSEDQFALLNILHKEYELAMLALNSLGPKTFTFYGGHMVHEEDASFKLVWQTAHQLALRGWGVVSGGGPGVMKAALEGSKSGEGKTIAFCIDIKDEDTIAEHRDVSITFSQFSPRKYALRQSDAFAFAPGGFGTLDEMMELLTLISTGKYPKKPIFLLDSNFWNGYIGWFEEILVNDRKVAKSDVMDLIVLVDTPEQVISNLYHINQSVPTS